MPSKDDDILKRLLAMFKIEAQEHLQAIASGLVELEKAAGEDARAGILDAVFRAAHSLKGAARTVNVADVEEVCQALESVFAALKRREIVSSPELFDVLHRSVDALGRLLQFIEAAPAGVPRPSVMDLTHSLRAVLQPGGRPAAPESTKLPEEAPVTSAARTVRDVTDTVRVSTARLDAVLLQSEELLVAKLAAGQHAIKLRQLQSRSSDWKKRWAHLRPDVRMVRQSLEGKGNGNGGTPASPQWMRLVQFLEWNQGFLESLDNELANQTAMADHDQRSIGMMVDNLLDEMKKVVMQPFSTLLDVFPRFIRELSRDQGKEIELDIHGGEIEIDRRILEEMKDPLIHLVRNCLDHGIETPAERRAQGKPSRGTITIGISARNGSNVELLIADDGAGIDTDKVRSAAVKQGLLSDGGATALDDKEAVSVIFESGISTSPIITDLSGRGLGLAIVKEKVEKLNGTLSVDTVAHGGTTFRMVLPLTLARFRGILVRAGEHLFVLPTSNVERAARVSKDDVRTVENRETVTIGGLAVSLARLGHVLGLPAAASAGGPSEFLSAVVLVTGQHRIAFVVDEVINEHEVLVKSLGRQLSRVWNIAGATVLGAGEVVPILSVPDLMQSAVRMSAAGIVPPVASAEAVAARKQSVLVAEDSITSRTLLKNILETAGYKVETAMDGVDAFMKLQSGEFDLVISDVDMPRMNGFGLTVKIRADKRFAELPVVLVTALESREDREHGIDAGASAYLVKSSFDQSNLLEVIKRFL